MEPIFQKVVPRPFRSRNRTSHPQTTASPPPEARENMLVFAAHGAVKPEPLARYEKALDRKLDSGDGTTFASPGFVEGACLDIMVRTDRSGFQIDEDEYEDDLIDQAKSLNSFGTGALTAVRDDLAPSLARLSRAEGRGDVGY